VIDKTLLSEFDETIIALIKFNLKKINERQTIDYIDVKKIDRKKLASEEAKLVSPDKS
jgi:hypothetical protein